MTDILLDLKSLLKYDDVIVVATSGGPDSMCLLSLLCELKSEYNLNIIVAHVNHKLRIESDEEALFVKEIAKNNNLIYEYMEIKEYDHDNLENEARKKRYQFFEKLVNNYHADYLMTAHHGDDLMETILMRMVRGSSIKGYSGFKKIVYLDNYAIVRPFITLTKKNIEEYMNNNNLKYYIDKTNFSLKYTRNRYRMKVLPFLKSENENVHLKFLKFSQELDKVNNFLEEYVKEIINGIKTKDGIKIDELLKFDKFLIQKVIEYELNLKYKNDIIQIDDKNTNAIYDLINSFKSNLQIDLPNNYIAVKDYNYFRIVYNTKRNDYFYRFDDEIRLDIGTIKRIDESSSKSNYVIRLNSKDIKLPLIIRSKKEGDKIQVKNLNGSKKIKDIFIDEKIPLSKRSEFPIVTDSEDTVLWIPGVKKSKFDVETNGIYDIILSYEEEENEY